MDQNLCLWRDMKLRKTQNCSSSVQSQGCAGAGQQGGSWGEEVRPEQVEVRRAARRHQHLLW